MIRILLSITAFIAMTALQLGFIASLPGVLALTPLVFGISIYMLQHHGLIDGVWWLVGFGLQLDMLGLAPMVPIALAYLAAGLVAVFSSRHLFSNRSYYGIVGCVLLATVAFGAVQALIGVITQLISARTVFWMLYGYDIMVKTLLALAVVSVMYPFARVIRNGLRVILPRASFRDTY
jgi:hypothetical protein